MNLLMRTTVPFGLVIACLFAEEPTFLPSLEKEITEGVVLSPSSFTRILGCPPSIIATSLNVEPRSIPIILLMIYI